MKLRKLLLPLLVCFVLSMCPFHVWCQLARQWDKYEIEVTNDRHYANPFTNTQLRVELTAPDQSIRKSEGFYDGGNRWKIRFMPDQLGVWTYRAWFTDRALRQFAGKVRCIPSEIPGMIAADETNPVWFGFRGGKHLLIRSLHVGDRFFAANWPDSARNRFLDWVADQKYNTLSIASFFLNRNQKERGEGWLTPDLWDSERQQPNPSAYTQMERILDTLAARRIIVFPFAGFFGQGSNYPQDPAGQKLYISYTIARLSGYWNLLFNVAGPEPTLSRLNQFSKNQIDDLGHLIDSMNYQKHLLTVHNEPNKNPFLSSSWPTFHCLQGASLHPDTLYHKICSGRNPGQPVMAQEVLWYGNMYQTKNPYTDEQIRRNAYIINMAAAALNFGDNKGNSSTGFTGSLNLNERHQDKHDIIGKVWDFFETIPFYALKPSPAASNFGYTLCKPGAIYLTYLPQGGRVTIHTENTGMYHAEWINARDTGIRIKVGLTDGKDLQAPSGEDWLLYLRKQSQE